MRSRTGPCSTRCSTPRPARAGSRSTTVLVADGTPEMRERIERVLTNDPGIGVARHADAGYEEALETARKQGIRLPMLEG